MLADSYNSFKKEIQERNEHRRKARKKRENLSKIPVVSSLDEWLAARHDSKALHHEKKALEHSTEHLKAVKKKHKL